MWSLIQTQAAQAQKLFLSPPKCSSSPQLFLLMLRFQSLLSHSIYSFRYILFTPILLMMIPVSVQILQEADTKMELDV